VDDAAGVGTAPGHAPRLHLRHAQNSKVTGQEGDLDGELQTSGMHHSTGFDVEGALAVLEPTEAPGPLRSRLGDVECADDVSVLEQPP